MINMGGHDAVIIFDTIYRIAAEVKMERDL
jgi:hypothetical protein